MGYVVRLRTMETLTLPQAITCNIADDWLCFRSAQNDLLCAVNKGDVLWYSEGAEQAKKEPPPKLRPAVKKKARQ